MKMKGGGSSSVPRLTDKEAQTIAVEMAKMSLSALDQSEVQLGLDNARAVWMHYCHILLCSGLNAAMERAKASFDGNEYQKQEASKVAFSQIKFAIATVVAGAVETSVQVFFGQDVSYYCQLHEVKEPTNKEPC